MLLHYEKRQMKIENYSFMITKRCKHRLCCWTGHTLHYLRLINIEGNIAANRQKWMNKWKNEKRPIWVCVWWLGCPLVDFKTGVINSSWRFPPIILFFTALKRLIKLHINCTSRQSMNLFTEASSLMWNSFTVSSNKWTSYKNTELFEEWILVTRRFMYVHKLSLTIGGP